MAIEINGAYNNVYESAYAEQKQETAKKQDASRKEISETAEAQKNSKVENGKTKSSTASYTNELSKLVPSVDFKVGNSFSTAKNGKTLTVNPRLLEKMQNDPETEKEMKELIKGVESAVNMLENVNKASGWTVVFKHSYIDENGKYRSIAYLRNDFMLNMSDKLREERRKNSEKLIEKTKEKAAEKKEELAETIEERKEELAEISVEKKEANEDGADGKVVEKSTPDKAKQLLNEKLAASKDGMIYLNDTDIRTMIEAAKEDHAGKANTKQLAGVGVNLDLKI